jgi:hypothetical protein
MGKRRAAFTQLDVQRAVRGARAAGIQPDELRISPTGEIRILFSSAQGSTETPRDVLDEIERHFGDGGA